MWPSKVKPYSGIFVKKQYDILKEQPDLDIELFTHKRRITSGLGSLLKYIKVYLRFIPKIFNKYSIIHLHFFYPLIVCAYVYKLFRPDTKLIVTFHGSDIKKHIKEGWERKIFLKLAKCVDYTVSVGSELAEIIESKLELKVDIVLNAGIDFSVFKKIENIKKIYDFTFVGSLTEIKGFDTFIEALNAITGRNISCCIVGSGHLSHQIDNLNSNISTDFFDFQPQSEIAKLMNKSRFIVLPSRNESFGLAVAEGMGCGVPAIVSDEGGLKKQITNELNGFVMQEYTAECLATNMEKSLSIDEVTYNKLCANALKSNLESSLETVCDKLVEIYNNLES